MIASPRLWTVGALVAGAAVLLGAFGAHGLESITDDARRLAVWKTAAQYHLAHGLALLIAALHPGRPIWGPRLFGAGILLFSGSLYLLALTGVTKLGAITPLGGVCFIAGWIALARAR